MDFLTKMKLTSVCLIPLMVMVEGGGDLSEDEVETVAALEEAGYLKSLKDGLLFTSNLTSNVITPEHTNNILMVQKFNNNPKDWILSKVSEEQCVGMFGEYESEFDELGSIENTGEDNNAEDLKEDNTASIDDNDTTDIPDSDKLAKTENVEKNDSKLEVKTEPKVDPELEKESKKEKTTTAKKTAPKKKTTPKKKPGKKSK